ncbi:acyltransferase [Mumia sp. zg.B53]|uniref:acyltransferase family protein n=1 Tax=Mumia sp. zg.B53 TaxID=2855449 RepID=UPI001C6E8297|nr:acyltransferase family protein [Mumia sp. zg.B53]MBW9214114.1 acyltransferase [Mumia sp. zg.B53]
MSSTVESRRARPAVGASVPQATPVRPEIQGLRAIAVGLVVVFHLWPNRLPGGYLGVDVFFVISGYLITAHILRESDRTGTIALGAFWARRARRLLPAAYLVLAASLVAVVVWVPRMLWQQFAREIGAAALYVENWALAHDAVDYLAADNVASPAQHYWTLSAEEQFYLVWPLLVLAGLWLAPVLAPSLGVRRQRLAVGGVLGAVTLASFAYSLYLTAADPARSYFVTTTRAWEFGAGAMLAFVPVLAGRRHIRAAISWAGLLLLVVCALRMTEETPMPGTAAVWVVLGTCALLWAGHPEVGWSPTRALAWRPAQFVGDVSYSIYLWHWPLIVILPYATGSDLGMLDKLAIALATLLLAWATKVWVEDPVRTGRKFGLRRSSVTFGLTAATAGALVVGCFAGWSVVERDNEARAAAADALLTQHGGCFGAASRDPAKSDVCPDPSLEDAIIPDPSEVKTEHATYERCAKHLRGATFEGCPFGTPRRGVPHIAVIGDSHARAMMPMFEILIEQGVLTAEMFSSPGCAWSTVPPAAGNTQGRKKACAALKSNLADLLAKDADRFDFIVTTNRASSQRASQEERVQGLLDVWRPARAARVPIVAVRDNPEGGRLPEDNPNLCLGEVGAAGAESCALSRKEAVTDNFDPYGEAVKKIGKKKRAVHLDMTRWFCDEDTCPVVIGGANVYRDSNHITMTYARTMAPYYRKALVKAGLLDRRR